MVEAADSKWDVFIIERAQNDGYCAGVYLNLVSTTEITPSKIQNKEVSPTGSAFAYIKFDFHCNHHLFWAGRSSGEEWFSSRLKDISLEAVTPEKFPLTRPRTEYSKDLLERIGMTTYEEKETLVDIKDMSKSGEQDAKAHSLELLKKMLKTGSNAHYWTFTGGIWKRAYSLDNLLESTFTR